MTDTLVTLDRLHLDAPITLAADESGQREFTALGVPYGIEIDRPLWALGTRTLKFDPASVTFTESSKVYYGHDWQVSGMPIGRVLHATETEDGPRVACALAKTTKADEVYALMRPDTAGGAVLDRVSIGFQITDYRVEAADTDAPVCVVTAAEAFEISVVPMPAYDGAAVESVLHRKEPEMPTEAPPAPATLSRDEAERFQGIIDGLSESVDTLNAKVATLGQAPGPAAPGVPFASYGEFVRAMLASDETAARFVLDYTGGVSDDTTWTDTWVGDIIRLIERGRRVWGLFDSAPLPAEGSTIEYGKLTENTLDVRRQLEEGDRLVVGKIKVGTDHADVITLGGAAEGSFQQFKRSNVNVLELIWRALAIAYAKTSESYARQVLAGVSAHQIGTLSDLDGIDGWIDFLVDSALHFDDKGLAPEYLRISPDVFKRLAKLREGADGPFLLNRELGRVNLLGVAGSSAGDLSGLRYTVTPGTNVIEIGNSFALKTYESPGAPLRLGPDEDILHLTQAVGVYGFGAIAVQDPEAIVRPAGASGGEYGPVDPDPADDDEPGDN